MDEQLQTWSVRERPELERGRTIGLSSPDGLLLSFMGSSACNELTEHLSLPNVLLLSVRVITSCSKIGDTESWSEFTAPASAS